MKPTRIKHQGTGAERASKLPVLPKDVVGSLRKLLLGAIALVCVAACGAESTTSATDTKTNWLGQCEKDSECSEGLECLCGMCTRGCEQTDECSSLGQSAACRASSQCTGAKRVCQAPEVTGNDAGSQGPDDEPMGASGEPGTPTPSDTPASSPGSQPSPSAEPTPDPVDASGNPEPTDVSSDAGMACPRPLSDYALLGDACLAADFNCQSYFQDSCGCGCDDAQMCEHDDSEYLARGDGCQTIRFKCADDAELFFDDCGCGCAVPPTTTDGGVCDQPGRMYVERDPNTCLATDFLCDTGLQYFYDDCGCGCEPACDVEGRNYQSHDPAECRAINFVCVRGMTQFKDSCGCGCEPDGSADAGPVTPAPSEQCPARTDGTSVNALELDSGFDHCDVSLDEGILISSEEELQALEDECGIAVTDSGVDFVHKQLLAVSVDGYASVGLVGAVQVDTTIYVTVEAKMYCGDALMPNGVALIELDVSDTVLVQDTCKSTECSP
jgi:hypothetical protein